ncbi:M20 aminoacylase family protein [Pollutimonas harenae]|uniref:Amidohydrolase n=1 Tax=Pollutimonas harenae TaxID=657015 RepID=A0A853H0I9_9BURK|nr:M20 aminoacylase family protein [Pollutimonas harenae]NYT86496.1 amidohydrolase [Pollutimonas harenae]TEA69759.1 amidohydrolase [Pollutimonas harenae]
MKLVEPILGWQDEIAAIRRDLHAHPELAYQENRTSDIVAQQLESWGIEVHRGLGVTGVVGVIPGTSNNGRSIGLRADMDALPMQESNTFAHASTYPGKMHACGHDGHTAMLLAAARYLAQHRDFEGVVYVIFQPAEEGHVGARRMIEDGLFTRFPIEAVFGMHNWPSLPVGKFGVCVGPIMASSNYFTVRITGKGAHAAMPHMGVDPIMAATNLAQALQSIVTRNRNPYDPAVLSITQIHAGSADNVIPDTAELRGTVRTFTEETLDIIEQRIRELVHSISEGYGCTADFAFDRKYPPTINHPKETAFSVQVLKDLVGPENVDAEVQPAMTGEDFALMLKERPGCYLWIGNGQGDHRLPGHGEGPCTLHNASYDFNDELIPIGASYWVQLARRWLATAHSI